MNNPVEQINAIKNMDDFLNFVVALAMDAKENPSEWANKTLAKLFSYLLGEKNIE